VDINLKTLKNHEDWNESYYFNFHDRNNDLTAFMRIGNKINKNEKSMFFFLMTPQMIAGIKLETPCDDKPLNIAGLKYEEMSTGEWKLKFDGSIFDPLAEVLKEFKVKMDITWEVLNPVMDYVDCVDEKQTEMSSNVYQNIMNSLERLQEQSKLMMRYLKLKHWVKEISVVV
jgi:hypothetical protein